MEKFSPTAASLSVNDELFRIHQGRNSVGDYAFRFRTLVAVIGWNETALLTAYWRGLNAEIR